MFQLLLRENHIKLALKPSKNKEDIFHDLLTVDGLKHFSQKEKDQFVKLLMGRELLGTTAVGDQTALPHAFCKDLLEPLVILGVSSEGVDFGSLDGDLVYIFFLVLLPDSAEGRNLKKSLLHGALAFFSDRFIRQLLRQVQSGDEALEIIRREAGLSIEAAVAGK